jgi:hypothetical protein
MHRFNGLEAYNSIREVFDNLEVWTNTFVLIEFNTFILWLVEENNESTLFKGMGLHSIYIIGLLYLVYPIVVSNYWLYFGLLMIPLSIMSSGIMKTPLKSLFWLIEVVLTIYSIYTVNYKILGIVVLSYLLKYFPQKAKTIYRDSMIKYALKNELKFKFLYYIRMISLYNRQTETLIKCD